MKQYAKNESGQVAVYDSDNHDAGWVILPEDQSTAVLSAFDTGTMGAVGAGAQRALTQFDKGVMELFGKPREPDPAAELEWQITQQQSPIATAIGESAPYMAVGGPLGAVGRGAGLVANMALQGGGAAAIAGLMPGSPQERAQNAAIAGGLGAAGEGVLGGAAAAYRALRGAGRLEPPAPGTPAANMVDAAERFDVPILRADIKPPSNTVANLIRTAGPMVNARNAQSEALEQALVGMTDNPLISPWGASQVPTTINQLLDADRTVARELYDKVQSLAPSAPVVPTVNTQAALERALERASASAIPDQPLISTLTKAKDNIAKLGGNATYSFMRSFRSDLGSRLADMKRGLGSPVGSMASRDLDQVRSAVAQDLTDYTLSSGNAELAKAAKAADSWYRETVGRYKDPSESLRSLIKFEGPDADRKVSTWLKGTGPDRYEDLASFLSYRPPEGVSSAASSGRTTAAMEAKLALERSIIDNTITGSAGPSGAFSAQRLANQQRNASTRSPLANSPLSDTEISELIGLSGQLAPAITRSGGVDPLTGVQLLNPLASATGAAVGAAAGSLLGGPVGAVVGTITGPGIKNLISNSLAKRYARTAVMTSPPPPSQRGVAGAISRAMAVQGAPGIITPQWQKDLAITDEQERREEINRQHVGDNVYDQASTAIDAATDVEGRVDPLVLTAQLSDIPAAMWRQSGVTRVGATNALMLADRLSLYLTPTRAMTAIGDPTTHWFAQHALDPTIGMAAQSQMVQSFTNTIMEA